MTQAYFITLYAYHQPFMNHVSPPRLILPAVAAAIFNDAGEVLLQKRNDMGSWCIISGHVEFGETIEQAILREIEEKTHVQGDIMRFIGVYSVPDSQTYFYEGKTVQYVTSYFEARLKGEIPRHFSNAETRELKFFAPEALPADLALNNEHWLKDALDRTAHVFIR